MARKPKQQRSRATVDAIIQAALIAISRQGPGGTTAREIAELAGIGVGSLYEYFANKEAIFNAAAERFVADTVAMVQPLVPQLVRMEIREAVVTLLRSFRDFLEQNDQLYLKCARHAFAVDMAVYQKPINRMLMNLFSQYLMHQPHMTRVPRIPALAFFYINGSTFTMIQHLSEETPSVPFDELTGVLADMLACYVEQHLADDPS
ncbi:transcriptional regulator [Alcanivorax hongdengensis A-11-3]|uniref:Transcriptional regulator n=1 Tax=Alcanivorax hongdengensis A-11-3 TaxID=1177179 RepID=L0WIY5_9GAMM|nr:TetR/AcrR family transcriptional regulator [Alcanivorax hongdengensis]EKF76152.1 transcriptional regulator [Alcanivorax hongdengensis A-11-3]